MGKRLSRIVTRTGDDGRTGLADGGRIPKHAARMQAIGTVDELNSQIGVFLAELARAGQHLSDHPVARIFRAVQNDLFNLGGELSMPGTVLVSESAWQYLEEELERLNGSLEPLNNFILPGGSPEVAQCHVVRAVARRAERCYTALCAEAAAAPEAHQINDASRIYLNRLSDLAFVSARWLARQNGETEILWQQNPRP